MICGPASLTIIVMIFEDAADHRSSPASISCESAHPSFSHFGRNIISSAPQGVAGIGMPHSSPLSPPQGVGDNIPHINSHSASQDVAANNVGCNDCGYKSIRHLIEKMKSHECMRTKARAFFASYNPLAASSFIRREQISAELGKCAIVALQGTRVVEKHPAFSLFS